MGGVEVEVQDRMHYVCYIWTKEDEQDFFLIMFFIITYYCFKDLLILTKITQESKLLMKV